jgi:hypothetical protein
MNGLKVGKVQLNNYYTGKGGTNMIINNALNMVYTYLQTIYEQEELITICCELKEIARCDDYMFVRQDSQTLYSYDDIQEKLSKFNEIETK